MILIQEKVIIADVGEFWVDMTVVDSDDQARQFIQDDDKQREAYRLLPLAAQPREVNIEIVPKVRFVPKDHQFDFGPNPSRD